VGKSATVGHSRFPFAVLFRLHRDADYCYDVRGAVSVCQSVRPSVCLSRSSTRIRCAKVAKRIQILFVLNTLKGPTNIASDGGPNFLTARGGRFDAAFNKLLWSLLLYTLSLCLGKKSFRDVICSFGRNSIKLYPILKKYRVGQKLRISI